MRRKKEDVKFKPSHDWLSKAIDEYLAEGGKITKLEFSKKNFNSFIATSEPPTAVDDFLMGN